VVTLRVLDVRNSGTLGELAIFWVVRVAEAFTRAHQPAETIAAPVDQNRNGVKALCSHWTPDLDKCRPTVLASASKGWHDSRSTGLVAMEHLLSVATWPRAALPPDFEGRFSVEMIRSGHIRWRLDGAPPKRGWIMLPEGDSR
jgi:hypothetical protein